MKKGLHFADVAEIQEAVTDELKRRSKKRNFRQLFRNCMTAQKPVFMPMELILNLKKDMCLLFKQKSVLKLLDRTVCTVSRPVRKKLYNSL